MERLDFKFSAAQRNELMRCWKRSSEQGKVALFLDDVECCIGRWLPKANNPPTSTRQKLHSAACLSKASIEMISALEAMPPDVEGMLNVYWLQSCYGDDYTRRHREACKADRKNHIPRMLQAFADGLTGKVSTPYVSAVDKLPPNFHKQLPIVLGFLRHLDIAAKEFKKNEIGARQWKNKELEEDLAISIAFAYAKHFGKLPSPSNGSSFRRLASALSKLLGWDIGAHVVKCACDTVTIHHKNRPLS